MRVTYDAQVCIHAGNCVESLPTVFKVVDGQFVIDQRGASEAAIRQTVAACPSGALQITDDQTLTHPARPSGRRGLPLWHTGCRGERHIDMALIARPIWRHLRRPMAILPPLRERARHLKAETFALYLAARHTATPWYAKLVVAAVVAYALSPIDLIPDFVPILGYLDDLVLIPLGVTLAIKMIPPAVMSECRARAREVMANGKPVSRVAGAAIVLIWLTLVILLAIWTYEALASDRSAHAIELNWRA